MQIRSHGPSGWLVWVGSHISPSVRRTVAISGSRPRDYPHRWILSRVRCIAWFGLLGQGTHIDSFGIAPELVGAKLARIRVIVVRIEDMRADWNDVVFSIHNDFERRFTLHMDSPRSTKPQEIRLPCSFNLRTRYREASNHHRPATLTSDKSLGDGAENEYGNEDRYAKGCLDGSSHLLPELVFIRSV